MLLPALLRLGRASNLSTVWTNALSGAVLAGGDWRSRRFGMALLAMSLFYVSGMYFNDYFDRAIDAVARPERPIPSGMISARLVAMIGFGLLCAGFILIAAAGMPAATALGQTGRSRACASLLRTRAEMAIFQSDLRSLRRWRPDRTGWPRRPSGESDGRSAPRP